VSAPTRLKPFTQVDGATDSPDGSASTSFCTGQEPAPQQQPPQQQQQQQRNPQHQEQHQQSHYGAPAAATQQQQQQESTSAMVQSAPRLPRCGSAFVDSVFGPAQLPDEQRTMLKDLLNEGISSNSYRTIISQQMRKLPPERVRSPDTHPRPQLDLEMMQAWRTARRSCQTARTATDQTVAQHAVFLTLLSQSDNSVAFNPSCS